MKVYPVREGLTIALITVLAIGVNIWWTYQRALEALQGEIKEGLQRTVAANAEMLDGALADEHKAFHPPDKAGNYYQPNDANATYAKAWERLQTDKDWAQWRKDMKASPQYQEWTRRMEAVRKATVHVRYLYTCVLIDGKVFFAFDEVPQNDTYNNDTGPYVPGGDKPDGLPDPPPTLLWPYPDAGAGQVEALKNGVPAVEAEPYSDTWGTYYSAYAPFYDSEGNMVGTLGMDLELEGFNKRLEPVKIALKRAAVTGLCLAILSGVAVWFARRLAVQLSKEAASHGKATLAEQQAAAGAYARALLRLPEEQSKVLLEATAPAGLSSNFTLEALRIAVSNSASADGFELNLTFAADIPEILHGPFDRISAALSDSARHLATVSTDDRPVDLTIQMVGETIQWVRLRIEGGDPAGLGEHSAVADLIEQGWIHAAAAQAHARAAGGDGAANEKGIRFVIPVRKEVA